tara:strand:- start:1031 stop:1675 length:645 start_codon:yes stop_codon:yes gene_type:complete
MKFNKSLLFFTSLVFMLTACVECESSEADQGVASLNQALAMPVIQDNDEDVDGVSLQPTDEEIATEFTSCMRDNGFSVADPELNADGTINIEKIRTEIMSNVGNNANTERRQGAFRDCVPILQNATFAQPREEEDIIVLQDRLLEMAECLRDDGVNVPDPDFSGGIRSGMMSMLGDVNVQNVKVQKSLTLCREIVFNNPPTGNNNGPRSNMRNR